MDISEKQHTNTKILSYKYRIYPNKQQQEQLAQYFGCARALFNTCIFINKTQYELFKDGEVNKGFLSKFDMISHMRTLHDNPDYPWLKEYPSDIKNMVIGNADSAFQNFFRVKGKVGYPKFKKKHEDRQSFGLSIRPDKKLIVNNRIKVPKMDPIKIKLHRPYKGVVKQLHIEYKAGEYHAILVCKEEELLKPPKIISEAIKKPIGIDLGIRKLATLSDGKVFDNPRTLKKFANKLANLQRKLSFKTRGSISYNYLKSRINKLHLKISRIRNHTLHVVSKWIVENYDLICLEDLDIKNMFKNRYIAKGISDASLSKLIEYISYKAKHLGKRVLYVSRWFPSSKRCSKCSKINKALKTQESWTCDCCGTKHDRDMNASKNILEEVLSYIQKLGNITNTDVMFTIKH